DAPARESRALEHSPRGVRAIARELPVGVETRVLRRVRVSLDDDWIAERRELARDDLERLAHRRGHRRRRQREEFLSAAVLGELDAKPFLRLHDLDAVADR